MSSAALRVTPVRSRGELRRFVDLPYTLYDRARYPNWVPPLKAVTYDGLDLRTPFYQHATRECFIAWRGGRMVGRIAAIENRASMQHRDDRTGFWGWFECEDDGDAATALFDAAATWLRLRGMDTMIGPMNPSTNYECGLLVDGFENRPTFLTAWNPPYYDALCTHAGLAKAKDLLALWFPIADPNYRWPESTQRIVDRAIRTSRVEFRDIDLKHFERDLRITWEIYNESWHDNWGFIPVSFEEFRVMAKDLKLLMLPGLSFIASIDGKPAGFMFALPDYNQVLVHNRGGGLFPLGLARMLAYKRRPRVARVLALGVRSEYRKRGILAVFAHRIMQRGYELGGEGAEASWLLEDNTLIVQPLRTMGARDRMRWRLYDASTSRG